MIKDEDSKTTDRIRIHGVYWVTSCVAANHFHGFNKRVFLKTETHVEVEQMVTMESQS
ncbi:unnamed protein product [Tetraodon nigroviridis]|uniref:(spotted green pufferfish) hypothetical protein n=1 Tax=Tetraodon nigroviridis TaxID=99883 RepID=Q4RFY8_TETNG|nr:unnamed protein product [Tetraodon nigroviridis]